MSSGRALGTILVVGCFLLAAPLAAWAGSGSARVIPQGSLGLLDGQTEVQTIQSEIPAPDGQLFLCHGTCLIQSSGVQFVGQDEAVIALTETEEGLNLHVKRGRVDFAIKPNAPAVSLVTAHEVIGIQEAVFTAATQSRVTGTLQVNEQGSSLAVSQGALKVFAAGQEHFIQSGKAIQLAQATVTGGGTGGGGSEAGGVGTGAWIGPAVAGTVFAGAAVGAVVYHENQKDDDEPTSPF